LNNAEYLKTLFSQAVKELATHQKSKAKLKKPFQVLLVDHNGKKGVNSKSTTKKVT
jgi:hypothetical protein